MYSILPSINRDWILDRLAQEEIMERYLGRAIKINEKFKSPFREDNSPSCVFYYNKQGKLFFRDFGQGRPMDCFDVCQKVNDLTFSETLKTITDDFNLINGTAPRKDYSHLEAQKAEAEGPTIMSIEPVTQAGRLHYTKEALDFWQAVGVSQQTLQKYKVFQVERAYCNQRAVFRNTTNEPGFAYWFGGGDYKFYFPFKKEYRFMQNTDAIQGEAQLPAEGDTLVITKSMKDTMLFHEFGIAACAPQSEVHPFTDEQVADWKRRFNRIVLVYDYDYTGVKNVNKLRKQYELDYLFVSGAKDLSDLYKASPYHAEAWINKNF